MARTLCKLLGAVLLIVGLVGFAMPNLLGMHLGLRSTTSSIC
ncbi:MAG TPA: hypothetical protein VFW15_15055 [Thermoanaerobaculia bacterium]|nr:hypothetical protein [Thermoanaerobaculia bacterium]